MLRSTAVLNELLERVKGLEHEAEMMRTVLIVKEPGTVQAAQSYDGLRKQILAGAAERRSHLSQLVAMQVALSRATSLDDLRPQVLEWLEQAGVGEVREVPSDSEPRDLFEDLDGRGLGGSIEIVEPAYFDLQTGALLRLGRARSATPLRPATSSPLAPATKLTPPEPVDDVRALPADAAPTTIPHQEDTP